jgi:ubiquinone/menaquinone biosynthesis C-methylase UbiE
MGRALTRTVAGRNAEHMEGHPWLAATIDWAMRPLYPARREVVPDATGRVLEIGVGTGLNFGLYGDIDELIGIEPDPHMLERARQRTEEVGRPVSLHQVGAERMPFEDESFDTVVLTFTLCTIPDVAASLAEMRRVLRREGRLLFVEQTRSKQPGLARVQDALTPVWKIFGGGCHLNRPAPDLIRQHGFAVPEVTAVWRDTWTLLPVYRGVALRA